MDEPRDSTVNGAMRKFRRTAWAITPAAHAGALPRYHAQADRPTPAINAPHLSGVREPRYGVAWCLPVTRGTWDSRQAERLDIAGGADIIAVR